MKGREKCPHMGYITGEAREQVSMFPATWTSSYRRIMCVG